jgi:hypothetical protein
MKKLFIPLIVVFALFLLSSCNSGKNERGSADSLISADSLKIDTMIIPDTLVIDTSITL